jgi:predicted 3-demethylubiquinone-9 3-methyltransferase (glyoxalase superfamily)
MFFRGPASPGFRIALMSAVERITPFLWFDTNAEEAVAFYLSVFKNARQIGKLVRQIDDPSGPAGTVLTIDFELNGLQFTALNGGPFYKFNESISFVIRCDDQEQIDYYWEKLTEGRSETACGWLKDKFGLSWQVVPANIGELVSPPKAMQAMMKMKKLDIAELQRAGRS